MPIHTFVYVGDTSQFVITGGEITGHIPKCITVNLLSAPGYSGAAILADDYGLAVGYMGEVSHQKNNQHPSP